MQRPTKNVVIDIDLYNEIIKDGKYQESFTDILRRKLKISNQPNGFDEGK